MAKKGTQRQDRFQLLSAVHLFLFQEGKVLLLRRYNTGYEDGNYGVVAGHLDGGEEIKTAMIREAQEEVGIRIRPADMEVVGVMHRLSEDERIDFFLTATSWQGQVANREPHRCDRVAWFHLDGLPGNLIPYIRRALENYRRGNWFDSFGWEGEDRERSSLSIRPLHPEDREWVGQLVAERWGSEKVVTRGILYDVRDLPGFLAEREGERMGLLTYHIEGDGCEILTLDSLRSGLGIGTRLIEAVKETAQRAGCRRLWLITTNDNLAALGFYQRRGFQLVAIHRNGLEASRRLKPQIPRVGKEGIPLRDEIELEMEV